MTVGEREPEHERWPVRRLPAELRERYLAAGWWTDDTLGRVVERSLGAVPDAAVHVWSDTRPWHGTYAEVHAEALRLVTALRSAGIEPGDVVAFQLPNWREAVVAFYGLAMGSYVLVPIVHVYGSKEVKFILEQSGARGTSPQTVSVTSTTSRSSRTRRRGSCPPSSCTWSSGRPGSRNVATCVASSGAPSSARRHRPRSSATRTPTTCACSRTHRGPRAIRRA